MKTPDARTCAQACRALVVDADEALFGLLEEWLAAEGCSVALQDQGRFNLIVADVPFPRHSGHERLLRLGREHPGTPIVVLSSNFFPGIDSTGAIARSLGVARVLPKPVARDILLAAVSGLLEQAE